VLSQKGYVVVTAQDGREALNKLQEGEYDVVFTDIRMPGMDGLELAEKVHAGNAWTPVVIVTGFGSTENEVRARAAGVTAFLHKPLSPAMIEECAREALARPAPSISPAEIARTIETVQAKVAGRPSTLKHVAMTVAAPFIGLAYVLLAPFVALGMLAAVALKPAANLHLVKKTLTFLRNVLLFFASPFIGLLYILLLPVIGIGAAIWTLVRSKTNRPAAH
jgi:CheY-like chemotaxis protein